MRNNPVSTCAALASSTGRLVPSSSGGAVLLLRAFPQPCNVTPAYRWHSAHSPAGGPALQLPPRFSSVLTRYIFLLYRLTGYALSIVIKSQPRGGWNNRSPLAHFALVGIVGQGIQQRRYNPPHGCFFGFITHESQGVIPALVNHITG